MDVKIKYSWYGIDSTNNHLFWNHAGAFSADIPPGVYTALGLAAAIATAMNATADTATYTVTFDQTTQKFTFSQTTGAWTFFTNDPSFTAHEACGFKDNGVDRASTAVSPYTIASDIVVDTNHLDYCYVYVSWPGVDSIVSAAKDVNNNSLVGGAPIIAQVSTPTDWGRHMEFEWRQDRWIAHQIPEQVTMRLLDHDWNIVDTKGQDWSVHFKLWDLPGQAKSVNHTTIVRSNDNILSNATMDNEGIGDNAPLASRRSTKRSFQQLEIPAPGRESHPQRKRANIIGFPQTNFGI